MTTNYRYIHVNPFAGIIDAKPSVDTKRRHPKAEGESPGALLGARIQESTRGRIRTIWGDNPLAVQSIPPIDRVVTLESIKDLKRQKKGPEMMNIYAQLVTRAIRANIRCSALSKFLDDTKDTPTMIGFYKKNDGDHLVTKGRPTGTTINRSIWQHNLEQSLFYAIYHNTVDVTGSGDDLIRLGGALEAIGKFRTERAKYLDGVMDYSLTGEYALAIVQTDITNTMFIDYCDNCNLPVSKMGTGICPLCSRVPGRFRGIGPNR